MVPCNCCYIWLLKAARFCSVSVCAKLDDLNDEDVTLHSKRQVEFGMVVVVGETGVSKKEEAGVDPKVLK